MTTTIHLEYEGKTARLPLHRRESGDGSAAVSEQVNGRLGQQLQERLDAPQIGGPLPFRKRR